MLSRLFMAFRPTPTGPVPKSITSHGATVDDLPAELLLHIASYLSLRSLIVLRNVDRRWRAIVSAAADCGLPEATGNLLKAWIIAASSLSAKYPSSTYPAASSLPISDAASSVLSVSSGCSASLKSGRLTDKDRDGYVSSVEQYALSFRAVSHEDPGLSREFLMWLYEWPACAGLLLSMKTYPNMSGSWNPPRFRARGKSTLPARISSLSPYSVVSSLMNSASYHGSRGHGGIPWYYYQERVIFMLVLEGDDVLLPRVQLIEDPEPPTPQFANSPTIAAIPGRNGKVSTDSPTKTTRLRCSLLPQSPSHSGFGGDWARFLPISTIQNVRHECAAPGTSISPSTPSLSPNVDADPIIDPVEELLDDQADYSFERPPVPLYVLSGSGIGDRIAGSVCTIGPNAVLRIEAKSWSEWLVRVATDPAAEHSRSFRHDLPSASNVEAKASETSAGSSSSRTDASRNISQSSHSLSQVAPRVESDNKTNTSSVIRAKVENPPVAPPTSLDASPVAPGVIAQTEPFSDLAVLLAMLCVLVDVGMGRFRPLWWIMVYITMKFVVGI